MIHEDAVEDRKCGDTEPLCACTDGRGYGSGISKTLQGAGCRPDLYKRRRNFIVDPDGYWLEILP